MTNLELLDILGSVQGKYILQAQEMRAGGKKVRRYHYGRQLAAVIALILILTAFVHTAPGAAAVEYVKEKVTSLIEALFPPKKMATLIEGMEYEGDYAADGIEPEADAEEPKPGFAIYYDVDHYGMVKEGDTTYIRPCMSRKCILEYYGDTLAQLPEEEREQKIAAMLEQERAELTNPQPDPDLPACEIEITHLDLPYEQAASQERLELEGKWEIREFTDTNRITFDMQSGYEWNSLVEDRDYISDEQGGCFRIIRRYFLEATEGHGVRFAAIVNTFAVLPPQENTEAEPSAAICDSSEIQFQAEPITFDGYALTSDGDSVPVRLTMEVENVLKGEAAFQRMISQGTRLPAPETGKEYIFVTVKVTYEDGDLETLNFMENYPASWEAARVHFGISNENSNTEDVTQELANSIWGSNPFSERPLRKGESISGDVAFLQDVGNTQPLCFEGYGQVVKFQIQ